MTKVTNAFNIPAISNEKIALMNYLSLDSDNEDDWNSINQINNPQNDQFKWIINGSTFLVFNHKGRRFHVSHISQEMDSDVIFEFNSNWWAIKEIVMPSSVLDHAGRLGYRRYSLKGLGAGASKFGACEICRENPSETFYQTEERYYKHSSGVRKEGWTHHDCNSLFGHENCLKSVRRGEYVFTMSEGMREMDVYDEKVTTSVSSLT